jgi:hypothetical protein
MACFANGLKPEDLEKLARDMKPLRHSTFPIWTAGRLHVDDGEFQPVTERHAESFLHREWGIPIKIDRRPWYKVSSAELFYRSRAGRAALRRGIADRMSEITDRFLLLELTGGRG